MAERETTDKRRNQPPWLGFEKFLFIALLTVMCFVLVHEMVRHHFFSGGSLNHRSTATEP